MIEQKDEKVKKDEVIMVGDSLPDDVKAAEKFGIKGILLDRRNRYPKYKNRITSLKELGLARKLAGVSQLVKVR